MQTFNALTAKRMSTPTNMAEIEPAELIRCCVMNNPYVIIILKTEKHIYVNILIYTTNMIHFRCYPRF